MAELNTQFNPSDIPYLRRHDNSDAESARSFMTAYEEARKEASPMYKAEVAQMRQQTAQQVALAPIKQQFMQLQSEELVDQLDTAAQLKQANLKGTQAMSEISQRFNLSPNVAEFDLPWMWSKVAETGAPPKLLQFAQAVEKSVNTAQEIAIRKTDPAIKEADDYAKAVSTVNQIQDVLANARITNPVQRIQLNQQLQNAQARKQFLELKARRSQAGVSPGAAEKDANALQDARRKLKEAQAALDAGTGSQDDVDEAADYLSDLKSAMARQHPNPPKPSPLESAELKSLTARYEYVDKALGVLDAGGTPSGGENRDQLLEEKAMVMGKLKKLGKATAPDAAAPSKKLRWDPATGKLVE